MRRERKRSSEGNLAAVMSAGDTQIAPTDSDVAWLVSRPTEAKTDASAGEDTSSWLRCL